MSAKHTRKKTLSLQVSDLWSRVSENSCFQYSSCSHIKGIFQHKFNPWSNTPWHWVRSPLERSSFPTTSLCSFSNLRKDHTITIHCRWADVWCAGTPSVLLLKFGADLCIICCYEMLTRCHGVLDHGLNLRQNTFNLLVSSFHSCVG